MHSGVDIKSHILKGSVVAVIFTLFGSILAYLIRVTYSRTLTIEDYGLFYAVFGLFAMLSTYADLGFGEAIAYFIPKYFKEKDYGKLWNTFLYGQFVQLGVSIILALILAFFTPFISKNYFKVEESETIIYIFCIFLILNGFLNGINQIFTGLQKAKYFSSINTIKNSFVFVFSLVLVFLGLSSINNFGWSWLVSYLLTLVFFLFLLWKNHSFLTNNQIVRSSAFLKSLTKYAFPAFITTFIYSLMTASDIFFLTLYRGVFDVGIYNIIVPLASTSIIFLAPIHNILLPLTSYLMEGEKDKLSYILEKIYKIVPFLGVYFALFIILFPENIIATIFGDKWVPFSVFPLVILSSGYIFLLLGNLLGTIALGLGRMKERLNILLIVGILNVILDAFFINKLGLIGSVFMDSFIAFLLVIVFTIMIKKYVNLSLDYSYYFKLLIFSLLIFFSIKIFSITPHDLFQLIIAGIIYTAIFFGFGYFLKIYDKNLIRLLLKR